MAESWVADKIHCWNEKITITGREDTRSRWFHVPLQFRNVTFLDSFLKEPPYDSEVGPIAYLLTLDNQKRLQIAEAFTGLEDFLKRQHSLAIGTVPPGEGFTTYAYTREDVQALLSFAYHTYAKPDTLPDEPDFNSPRNIAARSLEILKDVAQKLEIGEIGEYSDQLRDRVLAIAEQVQTQTHKPSQGVKP